MAKRKTLNDLYAVGREATFTDDRGTKRKVWLAKLGAHDHQAAINRANAARARFMAAARDRDSDEYVLAQEAVFNLGEDPTTLIEVLASAKVAERISVIEAETEGEGIGGDDEDEQIEWAKDNYLKSLRDAWLGVDDDPGLQEVYAHAEAGDDEVDPALAKQARHVFSELKRFNDEVEARVEGELEEARNEYQDVPLEDLRELVIAQYIENGSLAEWGRVFRLARLFYGVREVDDHEERHFVNLERVERLDRKILEPLYAQYHALMIDDVEGKDSPPARSSSAPSGLPDTEETSDSSGRGDAAA